MLDAVDFAAELGMVWGDEAGRRRAAVREVFGDLDGSQPTAAPPPSDGASDDDDAILSLHMSSAVDIAARAEKLRYVFLGLMFALMPLLDPRRPLVSLLETYYGSSRTAPLQVFRSDGTLQSTESMEQVLGKATTLHGEVLRDDLWTIGMMHGATRLYDMMDGASLVLPGQPLLEFGRHFRNACAHGNRWHFYRGEPKHPAVLRGRPLTAALQGGQAAMGWVGPGDYLDYLEDLAAYLRSLP
jgi:hypothetical protein